MQPSTEKCCRLARTRRVIITGWLRSVCPDSGCLASPSIGLLLVEMERTPSHTWPFRLNQVTCTCLARFTRSTQSRDLRHAWNTYVICVANSRKTVLFLDLPLYFSSFVLHVCSSSWMHWVLAVTMECMCNFCSCPADTSHTVQTTPCPCPREPF